MDENYVWSNPSCLSPYDLPSRPSLDEGLVPADESVGRHASFLALLPRGGEAGEHGLAVGEELAEVFDG